MKEESCQKKSISKNLKKCISFLKKYKTINLKDS